jgi:hypothetical protein
MPDTNESSVNEVKKKRYENQKIISFPLSKDDYRKFQDEQHSSGKFTYFLARELFLLGLKQYQ